MHLSWNLTVTWIVEEIKLDLEDYKDRQSMSQCGGTEQR